jgi:WD40 repeat protein
VSLDLATGLTFSRDGRRLGGSSRGGFGGLGHVYVWQLDYGRGIQTLRGLRSQVSNSCFSPDDRRAAALSQDWQVAIWELGSGRLLHLLDVPRGDTADNAALAFSPDGRRFAFSTSTDAGLWDIGTGRQVRAWKLPPGFQDRLAFHPSGKLLLFRVEARDRKRFSPVLPDRPLVCRVRDLFATKADESLTAEPLAAVSTFDRHVYRITAPPDGSYIVIAGRGADDPTRQLLGVFEGTTGKERWRRSEASGTPALDPAGSVMVYSPDNATCALVEMPSRKALDSLPAGARCLSPLARRFAMVRQGNGPGQPDTFSLFQRGDRHALLTIPIARGGGAGPFSFDGSRLAWSNGDGSLLVYHLDQVRKRLAEAGLGW